MFYVTLLLLNLNIYIKKNKKIFLSLFVFISLLACFRYGIGIDYFAYKYLYLVNNNTLNGVIHSPNLVQEMGYRIITFFSRMIMGYEVFIFLITSIISIFVYKYINKYSIDYRLSLLVYYCLFFLTMTMSGIRQAFVTAIGMYYFFNHNNRAKFYIVVLLLSLVHSSAIILILFELLKNIELKKTTWLIFFIIAFAFSISGISNYIPSNLRNVYYTPINLLDISLIVKRSYRVILFLLIWIKDQHFTELYDKQAKNIFYISIIIYLMLAPFEIVGARLMIYGLFSLIILLPRAQYFRSTSKRDISYLIAVSLLFSITFIKDIQYVKDKVFIGENHYLPYVNIFNKEKYEDKFFVRFNFENNE